MELVPPSSFVWSIEKLDFLTSEISFFTLCISLAFLSSLFVIVDARNMIIYMQKRKMKETIR